MKKGLTVMMAAFFLALMLGGSGQAAIQGTIYEGDSQGSYYPAGGPVAWSALYTFTVDQLNFDTRLLGNTNTTYDGFLGGPGNVNNLQGLTAAAVGKNILTDSDPLAPSPSPSVYGTLFKFTGTAFFAANTVIEHDDGFWLQLGNTIYNFSTPTAPDFDALNNAAGVYNFTLYYGAWNSIPEVLIVPGATAVPEPTTMLLLGLGMLGVAVLRRK